jgi:hypothetical protein
MHLVRILETLAHDMAILEAFSYDMPSLDLVENWSRNSLACTFASRVPHALPFEVAQMRDERVGSLQVRCSAGVLGGRHCLHCLKEGVDSEFLRVNSSATEFSKKHPNNRQDL